MEEIYFYTFLITLFFIFPIYKFMCRRKQYYNLPPSPTFALPILGHLHLIKQPLHRTLHKLSQKHGPIFSLRLGVRLVVVVSSPELVAECFTENDVVFANRPHVLVDKYIGYNHTTMTGAPYGSHWRNLRRLSAQEVLSIARLNTFEPIRRDEIKRLLRNLYKTSCNGFAKVVLRPKLSEVAFNIITRMVAGKRYFGEEKESEQGKIFRELISEVFKHAHASNPEDFLPFLNWIDYRGLKKNMAALGKKLDDFYEGLLEEHRLEKRNTMIGHLLSLKESQPELYTNQTLKGLITNMVIASIDTSVVTIEWAMSLLLNHPNVLQKASDELNTHISLNGLISEQDLSNLPYLKNIILETFRMFPAGPLLLPHESSADCKVQGYDVPRGTILLVNSWAIHRDPKVWDDPTSFRPERFEGKEVETHKLMPFGMGRRACPGSGLGQRMVGLALGSLIQCFEWKKVSGEKVDLSEGIGLTMPKKQPLEVMCKPRAIVHKVFQESDQNI
ncbi:cytochrome P450 81E8-like [Olea europaea var. sylvestris]|uniref:cytochrome P450 81E8-like n=1 Tax=Olea europaea var. sylvestris TaxID=158386 RepID=UPI000C1D802F|nr:cytochrome P450 81E8-like [Olea europaea var. sylvestris]